MKKRGLWGILIVIVLLSVFVVFKISEEKVLLSPIGLACPDEKKLTFSAGTTFAEKVVVTHDLTDPNVNTDADNNEACQILQKKLEQKCMQFLLNAGTGGAGFTCAVCEDGQIGGCEEDQSIPQGSNFRSEAAECNIIGPITNSDVVDENDNPVFSTSSVSTHVVCGGNDGELIIACVGMCQDPPEEEPKAGEHGGGGRSDEKTGGEEKGGSEESGQ